MSKEKIILDELYTSEMEIKIKQYEELLSIYREEMKLKDMKISYYESRNRQPIQKDGTEFFNKNFDITSDKLNLEIRRTGHSINITPTITNINDIPSLSNLNDPTNKSIDNVIIKKNICFIESELTRDSPPPQFDVNAFSCINEKNEDIPFNNVDTNINSELHKLHEKRIFNVESDLNFDERGGNKRLKINNTIEDDIPYDTEAFQNLLSPKLNKSNENKLRAIYKGLNIRDDMNDIPNNVENFPNFASLKPKQNIKNELRSTSHLESPRPFQMSTPDNRNIFFGRQKQTPILQDIYKDLQTQNQPNIMSISPNHKETKHRTVGSYSTSIQAQKLQRNTNNKEDKVKSRSPSNDYGDLFKKISSRTNDGVILKTSTNTSTKTGSAKIILDNIKDNSRGQSETKASTSYQKYNTLKKSHLQSVLNNYVSNKLGNSKSIYGMVIQKSVKDLKRLDSSRKLKFN